MIDTPARRRELIEILYFADDYVKMRPLAVRFGYLTRQSEMMSMHYHLSYRISSQTGPMVESNWKQKERTDISYSDETAAISRIMYSSRRRTCLLTVNPSRFGSDEDK